MKPLEGITAFVIGAGPDLPVGRLGRLRRYFTIAVNRASRTGIEPTVSFWTDPAVHAEDPAAFGGRLCVCAAAASVRPGAHVPGHIALPVLDGPVPPEPLARGVYRLGNTGASAAVWAAALGCYPVVLLGMGALDDGRPADELAAMRRGLAAALNAGIRSPCGRWPTLWPWRPQDFDENLLHDSITRCDAQATARALRESLP